MDVKEGKGVSRGLCWHSSVEALDVLLPYFERMKQMNMLERHLLKLLTRMKELQGLGQIHPSLRYSMRSQKFR